MNQIYDRPATLKDALALLNRPGLFNVPLAGGTVISRGGDLNLALVDLQELGLDSIQQQGNLLRIGSTIKLQTLLEANLFPSFSLAMNREAFLNTRNQASLGGSIITAEGRSVLVGVLTAVDARLTWEPGGFEISLGEWMLQRKSWARNRLLTEVSFSNQVDLRWECIARSPADLPVVFVAAGIWSSGRTRMVVGGFGPAPILVMDGPEASGADMIVENALLNADDAFASGQFRSQAGRAIVNRLLASY
jgi:CO/xanthine dehydrogenase FAD-binding subunit